MNRKITTTLVALWLAMPLALTSVGSASAQDSCVSAREAQPLVERGVVLSVDEAMRREGVSTRPSSVQLCNPGGDAYWLVNVMDAQADAKRIVLNAQTN